MKRDHVICLSTCLGDTYYLQTTSQAEVDSWIRTIHSGMYMYMYIKYASMYIELYKPLKFNQLILFTTINCCDV